MQCWTLHGKEVGVLERVHGRATKGLEDKSGGERLGELGSLVWRGQEDLIALCSDFKRGCDEVGSTSSAEQQAV